MLKAILYTIFYAAVIYVNYLANALPINGVTTGELSYRYNSLITPAGIAFSIWGVIYLFLLFWLIQLWVGVVRKHEDIIVDSGKILLLFPLSCLFNIGWLLTWHFGFLNINLLIMAALLLSLIGLYIKAEEFRSLWKFPFSTYLAWICVAFIVNVSVAAIYNEWVLFPEEWVKTTVFMMLIATILGLYILFKKSDVFFVLVLIWALYFIAVKNPEIKSIYFSGIGFIVLLMMNMISVIWVRWRKIYFRKG